MFQHGKRLQQVRIPSPVLREGLIRLLSFPGEQWSQVVCFVRSCGASLERFGDGGVLEWWHLGPVQFLVGIRPAVHRQDTERHEGCGAEVKLPSYWQEPTE